MGSVGGRPAEASGVGCTSKLARKQVGFGFICTIVKELQAVG